MSTEDVVELLAGVWDGRLERGQVRRFVDARFPRRTFTWNGGTILHSPVGTHRDLDRVELEEGLVAYRCPETGGHWIPAESYWRWQPTQLPSEMATSDVSPVDPVSEFDEALKLCPESGTIMTRYRVGHGLAFRVDRSVTGGIWLDAGEWEALRRGNLHRCLQMIFSARWQKAVREKERVRAYEAVLERRLGTELLGRIQALRDELSSHPHRSSALAYLYYGGP